MTEQISSIEDLQPDPDNARAHTPRNVGMIVSALQEVGAARSGVIDEEGRILAGNATWEALAEAGIERVKVVEADGNEWVVVQRSGLTEEQKKRLALYDNRTAELAGWDPEVLAGILADDEAALDGLFYDDELVELLGDLLEEEPPEDPGPQMDRAAELQEKWGTELGQVWELGEHRLACGDCTDLAVVESVMRGERANLLFTSPPYWVGMDYEKEKSEAEIDDFIRNCVRAWTDSVDVDNGRIVINTGTSAIHRIEKGRKVEVLPLVFKWQQELRQRGWLARHYRVWIKRGGLGHGRISPKVDAVDQHWETVTEFVHEEGVFIGAFWAPSGRQRGQEKIGTKWAQQGVWADVITGIHGAKGTEGHVAAFPLEIPERHVRLYTKTGEIVFEPFAGSGTTLVGCERLFRQCRAIEISPTYCAVAIQRMAGLGLEPRLAEG